MIGRVVSTKSLNTVTVLVDKIVKHPLYKKTYKQSKKYLVDAQVEVKVGDIVDFVSCKPVSKRKAWKVTKILGRSFAEIAEEQLKIGAEKVISEVMPEEKEELKTENSNIGIKVDELTKNTQPKKKGKTKLSK